MTKPLVLVVIDGLTPGMFESRVDDRTAPTLAALAERGTYRRAVSTFPSLTPVCLSSIATGAHPDVHRIPHLVWYHREERRVVEYGSSFAALRAVGFGRAVRDSILNMNERHLGAEAVTVFEALEDAGLTAAAVNFTCYRGRTRHRCVFPGLPPAYGPRRFFYFNLYESDVTGAPLSVRDRAAGSNDLYAAAVGRWLVTRGGFDLLVVYLSDYDYASHALGPDGASAALEHSDAQVGAIVDAAGGLDDFLDRYAVVVCSDHGQSRVHAARPLQRSFDGLDGVVVTASNRAGMVYRLDGCRDDARGLARRLDGDPDVDVALFREDGHVVARRAGEELRFAPDDGGWWTTGDRALLDHPHGLPRAWAALQNPNAGDVVVSAADGVEFTDLAGRHHVGGGSHGSLAVGDSEVPMLTLGLDAHPAPESITDVAPLVLAHFGVEAPRYARTAQHAS